MNFENLKYETREGIAFVTVNRPEKLNALNARTLEELVSVFSHIDGDEAVRATILTGAGEKAFVAGADIAELAALTALNGAEGARRGQGVFGAIEQSPKPTIAAINGYALGGGCELALACTLRLASENAKIGLPEVSLGIIPGYGGTQRLSRLVGQARAAEMILTGDPIDAATAERIGLVNRVVPRDRLLPEAEALAKRILTRGPRAVAAAIEAIRHGLDMPLAQGLEHEAVLFGALAATRDMHEGLQAC
ncbi:MAG: enoyl-CoA hydratase/isomerase family protein, partial [Planctomycetes bacterium]|nr:enoyl-CoA hydratase/isomerase family protein [Planctomycetota bacterium]